MIDSIYTRQLESVIFSINQYSDDIVSGWSNQIEQELQKKESSKKEIAQAFIDRNVSVEMLYFVNSMKIENVYSRNDSEIQLNYNIDSSQRVLDANAMSIKRLIQYMEEGGYRKIQPIDIQLKNHSLFVFAYQSSDGKTSICGIIVNTTGFIKENLGPKIQSVARDQFYFSVFDISTDEEIYSNERYESSDKNIEHKKALWLMPDYQLGIQLKGETIENLVQERTNFNLWIIVLMDLILIVAAAFVYRSLKQQMKLAQLKSEFISNVSHEIRTPLAIINMYSETLEMDRVKDDAKKKEYYSIINTEANRLSGMVNKILNFSKIESGKREYKFTETNPNEIVVQIINQYQHHFKGKDFVCNLESNDNIPTIMADPEAITDAIINLIDNAIKYSTDDKRFDIITDVNKNGVIIEVKDYGIGIDEKFQKFVFDKFYRVTDGNLAHKAKGSGIGLSIVHHIMSAHNGSVNLISSAGNGSRFILNFPFIKK